VHVERQPHGRWPLVVDVPHAGRQYPSGFAEGCAPASLYLTEDRFADVLYEPICALAGWSIQARFPRTFVDVNRTTIQNPLAIARPRCIDGARIYEVPPSDNELTRRIRSHYDPYYDALESAIGECVDAFGFALHLNLHTFPSTRIDRDTGERGPIPHQCYLGDRHGETANMSIARTLASRLRSSGLSVAHNDLFVGGEILRRVSKVRSGRVHSVQVEVRRDCYLHGDLEIDAERLAAVQRQLLDCVLAMLHDGVPDGPR
jgi:N-formylglutamate deformylase